MKRQILWITALAMGMSLVAAACQPGKAASPSPSPTTTPPASTTTPQRQIQGAFGTLDSINGNTLVMTTNAQGQATVHIGNTTVIEKTQAGALSDLKVGQLLTVVGSTDANGNIVAAAIGVRQPGQGTQVFQGGQGRNPGTIPSVPGNGANPGFQGAGNITAGSIAKIDGNTLTLTTAQGQATVTAGVDTVIRETVAGNVSDLQPGQSLAVAGSRDANGDITATSITIQFISRASGPTRTPTSSTGGAGPSIITTSLVAGNVGASYSQDLAASGGAPRYKWSITSGSLPDGLSLNSSKSVIAGVPTASGTFGFVVRVTDSAGAMSAGKFSIAIGPAAIGDTLRLPSGDVGVPYSHNLGGTTASGFPRDYSWVIPASSLPSGLYLNNETAQILGTPTSPGTYSFTAQLFGATAEAQSIILTITINSQPSITTTSLPDGKVGVSYSHIVTSAGGTTPYTWSVSGGTLPDGLSLDDSTSAIRGTPAVSGTFNFTATLTDAAGGVATQTLSLRIGPASAGN